MANKVVDGLAGVLADSYVLFTKTQNYHWNVVGPHFHSLHALFSDQYNELFTAIDEIAERIRQLGAVAPGTLAEFLKSTSVDETAAASAPGMLADLAACNEKVTKRASACLKAAQDAGDEGTVDLMVQRLNAHAKATWMLRASLGDVAIEPAAKPMAALPTTKKALPKKIKKKAKVAKAAAPVAKPAPTKVAPTAPAKASKPAAKSKAPASKPKPAATKKAKPAPAKPKGRVAVG